MQTNVFAWTEPTPPDGYPAFVSINRDESCQHSITVRARGNGGRDIVEVEMPIEVLHAMSTELREKLP